MSLLEPVHWQTKDLPIKLKRVVLAPEISTDSVSPILNPSSLSLLSPTSQDSGFGSISFSPISPSHSASVSLDISSQHPTPPFSCQQLVTAGGTGFSLGILDCESGTIQQLSVPVPQQLMESQSIDLTTFTLSNISSLAVVGDSQLWAGTNNGTLHCFGLTPEFRLKQHSFININEPILTIASRSMDRTFPPSSQPTKSLPSTTLTTEVLIGIPYGYVVVLTGEADAKGRLKQSIDKLSSRRIVRFTNSPIDCAVNCIIPVVSDDMETYWCACGGSIVVLRSRDWQKLVRIDAIVGLSSTSVEGHHQEIVQLVSSDIGVWSCVSRSSTVCLWDKNQYTMKLNLTYCNPQRSFPLQTETSYIHYTSSLLFIGTRQGDIMVFRISEKLPSSSAAPEKNESIGNSNPIQKTCSYQFITSTDIGSKPVVSIHTAVSQGGDLTILPDVPCSPISPNLNVLVVQENTESTSTLHMFEFSPSPPQSLCSSPFSDVTIGSIRSATLTPQRLSVVSSSSDYIPLKN